MKFKFKPKGNPTPNQHPAGAEIDESAVRQYLRDAAGIDLDDGVDLESVLSASRKEILKAAQRGASPRESQLARRLREAEEEKATLQRQIEERDATEKRARAYTETQQVIEGLGAKLSHGARPSDVIQLAVARGRLRYDAEGGRFVPYKDGAASGEKMDAALGNFLQTEIPGLLAATPGVPTIRPPGTQRPAPSQEIYKGLDLKTREGRVAALAREHESDPGVLRDFTDRIARGSQPSAEAPATGAEAN